MLNFQSVRSDYLQLFGESDEKHVRGKSAKRPRFFACGRVCLDVRARMPPSVTATAGPAVHSGFPLDEGRVVSKGGALSGGTWSEPLRPASAGSVGLFPTRACF